MDTPPPLLAPYRVGPRTRDGWFVQDVPPPTARAALDVGAGGAPDDGRPAIPGRPPQSWLIACAEQLDGRLVGMVDTTGAPRFIGVKVPRRHAERLLALVADDFPSGADGPAALASAVGEVYPGWGTSRTAWQGPGPELLLEQPHGDVVGLWWD